MAKEQLTPKQEVFCRAYYSIDSETWDKKGESALAAGYAGVNSATTLCKDAHIQKRGQQIYEENAPKHKGRILSGLEYNRRQAVQDHKWDAANTSLKLQAQICGFLFESQLGIEKPKPEPPLTKEQEKIYRDATHKLNLLSIKPHALNLEDAQRGRDNVAGVG